VSLADDPETLVLHVIAAPTAAQLEAELGLPEVEEEAPAEGAAEAPAEGRPEAAEAGAAAESPAEPS